MEIPIQALQTFREKYPMTSGIPKRMRIEHDYITIDQGIQYAIMVLIEAGYTKNIHFPEYIWAASNYNMKGLLTHNPVITGVRDGFYDYAYAGQGWRYPTKPPSSVFPWHEILISPFTAHHERSLLLTFGQLGFTVGELQLWLEVQIKNINETKDYIKKENERIRKEWEKKYVEEHGENADPSPSQAWLQHCYRHSPHNYPKYVQLKPSEHNSKSYYTLSGSTTNNWYNWRNYLHYSHWIAHPYPAPYQNRAVYEKILNQPKSNWYLKIKAHTYVPYLFVNPEVDLVQSKYVLSHKAQQFIEANINLFPKLPEEVVEQSRERKKLEVKYEVSENG